LVQVSHEHKKEKNTRSLSQENGKTKTEERRWTEKKKKKENN